MSREIKFRAWDGVLDRMCSWEEVRYVFSWIVNDKDYDLMQFTGLRDKNGKEIYEGDIVCGSVSLVNGYDFASDQETFDDETFQSPITFNNGAFQAFINPWESLLSLDEAVANNIEFTVIGNIHESPELVTP